MFFNPLKKGQNLLLKAGRFGHTCRGIVFGLMAYLTIKSKSSITEQTDAFSNIRDEFDSPLRAIIAVGFVGYGIICSSRRNILLSPFQFPKNPKVASKTHFKESICTFPPFVDAL